MSTRCQKCKAELDSAYLCDRCTGNLRQMLGEVGWLSEQLTVTRTRQDKLNGTNGIRGSERPAGFHENAMKLAVELDSLLGDWVVTLRDDHGLRFMPAMAAGADFIGPLPKNWRRLPRGYRSDAKQCAVWLSHHAGVIACRRDAGEFYRGVSRLIGDPDIPSDPGKIVNAIHRRRTVFVGPCDGIRSRHGQPVECGAILYADLDESFVFCARCTTVVDVHKHREKLKKSRDALPERLIKQVLEESGEKVPQHRLRGWITSGRLTRLGYLSDGQVVSKRRRMTEPAVYSLHQAQLLQQQLLKQETEDAQPHNESVA
ncbi:hypothetical protein EB72_24705 [Mycobacterium sp. SWH-M1]|nr:hypothetical protein EB72_24705 [Mycobacterium sp. SWH-M1]